VLVEAVLVGAVQVVVVDTGVADKVAGKVGGACRRVVAAVGSSEGIVVAEVDDEEVVLVELEGDIAVLELVGMMPCLNKEHWSYEVGQASGFAAVGAMMAEREWAENAFEVEQTGEEKPEREAASVEASLLPLAFQDVAQLTPWLVFASLLCHS